MKLIIDIDDELVETAKFAVHLDMGSDYVKSIADGTPLDNLRAEIGALAPKGTAEDVIDGNPIKEAVWETIYDVLQIIDKYRNEVSK